MDRHLGSQFSYASLFWPALAAVSFSETASALAAQMMGFGADRDHAAQEPGGATPSKMALELHAVRLCDFSTVASGVPTLLCTPLALHGSRIADLATGHSLVAALCAGGVDRLFMAEWRSASPDMRFRGIDDYLADLNVLVDHLGGSVDLIGLCQGGWLSLVYAARFPGKVRKLVMAGAPVDIAARSSALSAVAATTPLSMFQGLVNLGGGRVIGRNVAQFWDVDGVDADYVRDSLQTLQPTGSPEFNRLKAIFESWNAWTIDAPGTYYLEVVQKLYKRNELATGDFVALGQKINLSHLRVPMYLLAGSLDEVVASEQLLAAERLVGTRPEDLHHKVASSNHLGLFMGRRSLEEYWPMIARWLKEPVLKGAL
ncbi:alpha/beta fold hydrolase [Bradyrhizobium ontarionense]|uniref:Alpha/beta fold hydrolase n=1 Tax=Bradyrhizobium ontarionense TaxID=2898149 RepID=A0ABY3RKS6_9BRAD|nr:alpha/beta fold hydrolase [Bradyrhizobium sp. A19]UFZ07989.1 alpha/beta fold hydrolase [Bradyrhizobium sp. A19]